MKNPCDTCSEEPTICSGRNKACLEYAEYSAEVTKALAATFDCNKCIWSTQDEECQGQCLEEE